MSAGVESDRPGRGLPLVAVIMPCLNEAPTLPELHRRLSEMAARVEAGYRFKFVFVDDGSSDGTWSVIEELNRGDQRVAGVKLRRNFGALNALKAGLASVRADYYVDLSADLQDPPEVIPDMLAEAAKGFEVVWGQRAERQEGRKKVWLAKLFYRLTRNMAGSGFPEGGADIFLFRRPVIDYYLSLKERNALIHYAVSWSGFKASSVPYVRKARQVGRSRWTFSRRLTVAVGAFVSFSYLPIRLISYVGLFFSFLGFAGGVFLILNYLLGQPGSGWTSIMAGMSFLAGVQLLMLGVIAEYLWRAVDQLRERPEFLIEGSVGLQEPGDGSDS